MNPITTLLPKAFASPGIQFGATGPASVPTGDLIRKNDRFSGCLETGNGNINLFNCFISGGYVFTNNGTINLNKSRVSGSVSSNLGDIVVSNESEVKYLSTTQGNIVIEASQVKVGVSANNGDIEITNNSKIGDSGYIGHGPIVGTNNGRILISESTINGDVISTNGLVVIEDATVNGNVHGANSIPKVQNSNITGQLKLSAACMNVKDSTVGSIQVEKNTSGNSVSFSRISGVFIGGNIIGGSGISSSGIQLGVGSTCNINGYNIQPNSASQTTLTTPEGLIYVNGDKVYGDGPETYAAYKKQNQKAPSFSSPGWQDSGVKEKAEGTGASSPTEPAKPKEPEQVIFLEGNTVIQGDITFEGGNGKVVVGAGSQILGKVIGGIVENQ